MSMATIDLSNGAATQVKASQELIQTPAAGHDDAKLMKSCRQLESVFFNMMLKEMRKTIPQSGLLEDSAHEQEIFTEMLDSNIAEKMADTDKTDNGVANLLYRQLSGRKAYSGTGAPQSATLAAQTEEERKERFIHATRSFPIATPGHYRAAQVRVGYPTPAPRTIERPAESAPGR